MKFFTTTLLFFGCIAVAVGQQIGIQPADFSLSTTGADSITARLETKSGVTLPTEGSNLTWDYTGIKDSTSGIFYFGDIITPVQAPIPKQASNATLQSNGFSYFNTYALKTRTYYAVSSLFGYQNVADTVFPTGFSLQAITGSASDSLTFPGNFRKYGLTVYPFPSSTSYNTYSSSSTGGVPTDFKLTVGAVGLNKVPGQFIPRYLRVDTIVGWGTLKMKNPASGAALSFNALLVAHYESEVDSFFLNGSPAPALILSSFGLIQGSTTVNKSFYFLAKGFKFPLLEFDLDAKGNVANVFRGILPSIGLISDNTDLADLKVAVAAYPNPSSESVTFSFEKKSASNWRVFIYNSLGQIVKNENVGGPIGITAHTVRFDKSVSAGTLFYQIIDENSLIRNTGKIIFEDK